MCDCDFIECDFKLGLPAFPDGKRKQDAIFLHKGKKAKAKEKTNIIPYIQNL